MNIISHTHSQLGSSSN